MGVPSDDLTAAPNAYPKAGVLQNQSGNGSWKWYCQLHQQLLNCRVSTMYLVGFVGRRKVKVHSWDLTSSQGVETNIQKDLTMTLSGQVQFKWAIKGSTWHCSEHVGSGAQDHAGGTKRRAPGLPSSGSLAKRGIGEGAAGGRKKRLAAR